MRRTFIFGCMENLKLLKNKEYELVDWENLLEEIEDMARRELRSLINLMAVIMEHLYKWENYRESAYMGSGWKKSILNARKELIDLFDEIPSLKRIAQEKESLNKAWRRAVNSLITWFKEEEDLAQKYFGRFPTEEDFPKECPYTFEQIMECEPWMEKKINHLRA
jgi:hypothetical protein